MNLFEYLTQKEASKKKHNRAMTWSCLNFAKVFTNEDGRIFLTKKNNPRLFSLLTTIDFFNFYTTNNGEVVGMSQIIAFLSYGWKAYQNGFTAPKDEIEVHHIDGNVKNNNPKNLVYLSRQDHQYISNCTYTPFYGKVKYEASTPFNKQGKAVTNKHHFLVNIIQETVNAVAQYRSNQTVELPYFTVLASIPNLLWKKKHNFTNIPSWMTRSILNLLYPDNLSRNYVQISSLAS